ncbi:MAG: hypothetical protein AAFN74_16300, partial [Myxococcota bacterium]
MSSAHRYVTASSALRRGGRPPVGRILGLLVMLSGAACSDEDASGSFASQCTKDPVLIADERACRLDEDCPCGTAATH